MVLMLFGASGILRQTGLLRLTLCPSFQLTNSAGHFSNSCKSLASFFNEQVVHHLPLSLSLSAPYLRQLTNPNEQTLSHCTCISDLQSWQLITIASIQTLPPTAEWASVTHWEESGELRASANKTGCTVYSEEVCLSSQEQLLDMGLTQVVNQDGTVFTL